MKKSHVILLLFVGLVFGAKGQKQLLSSAAEKQMMKAIEEKPNRYFLKLFAGDYIRSFETDFDNSSYMDIEVKGDEITLTVKALDDEGYVVSSSVHGTELDINHVYVKVQGDVYLAKEYIKGEMLPHFSQMTIPHILYNSERGVYYHEYFSENNRGFSAFAATKGKVKFTEASTTYDVAKLYEKKYEEALLSYNSEIPKKYAAVILAKKDDGVLSEFHKANVGKVLFGNNITKENVMTAATYKSKFTIDEHIVFTIFSDKGFNKFVDYEASDVEDIENLNGDRESQFILEMSFSNGHKASHTIRIAHPEGRFLTFAFQELVFGKNKSKNTDDNSWILKNSELGVLSAPLDVSVRILHMKDESVIAQGAFTYTPKANARMPYGRSCASSTDVKIKDFARIKPGLTTAFKKALLTKDETKGLTLTDFYIGSDWQSDNSLPDKYITVYFVVKNEAGVCFSGSDRYTWFDPKSLAEVGGYFIHAQSKFYSIVPDLYPFCDCK
jgi:hypothetical protein